MNKQNTRNKDEELRGLSIFAIFIFLKTNVITSDLQYNHGSFLFPLGMGTSFEQNPSSNKTEVRTETEPQFCSNF